MERLKSKRWGIRPQWLGYALLLFLVAGCQEGGVAVPGEHQSHGALTQPITLEEIYWATPAIVPRPAYGTTTVEQTTPNAATLLAEGAALYTVNCAPCHQANGEGKLTRFPALNQNAFVTNQSPQPLIRTVLYGRGVMPAFHVTLHDREVAAILSYIRNSWNNEAAVIDPTTVQGVAPMPLSTATPPPE